jgi:hypothetical protein
MKFGCDKHNGVVLRCTSGEDSKKVFRYEMRGSRAKTKSSVGATTTVDFPGEALASLNSNCEVFSDWITDLAGD